jgi:hypothetical protein
VSVNHLLHSFDQIEDRLVMSCAAHLFLTATVLYLCTLNRLIQAKVVSSFPAVRKILLLIGLN